MLIEADHACSRRANSTLCMIGTPASSAASRINRAV
jgi:hypothetical protein